MKFCDSVTFTAASDGDVADESFIVDRVEANVVYDTFQTIKG